MQIKALREVLLFLFVSFFCYYINTLTATFAVLKNILNGMICFNPQECAVIVIYNLHINALSYSPEPIQHTRSLQECNIRMQPVRI